VSKSAEVTGQIRLSVDGFRVKAVLLTGRSNGLFLADMLLKKRSNTSRSSLMRRKSTDRDFFPPDVIPQIAFLANG
jgi:hypothetical protein